MDAADVKRLKALELENSRLKKLLAEAATHMSYLHDLLVQILRGLVGLRWMAVAVTGEPHKPARVALR